MKKFLLLTSIVVVAISLVGCMKTENKDYSNQIVAGRVSSIDGTKITIEMMKFNNDEKEPFEGMPKDRRQDGMGPGPNDQGRFGPGGSGEMMAPPSDGEMMEPQRDGFNNDMPPRDYDMMEPSEDGFNPKDLETITIDIKDANILIENDMDSVSESSIEDIEVGTMIVLEFGDNNIIKNVTIRMDNGRPFDRPFDDFNGNDEVPFENSDEVPFENQD